MSNPCTKKPLFVPKTSYAGNFESPALGIEMMSQFAFHAIVVKQTVTNVTFDSGILEVQTVTFPDPQDAIDGDTLIFYQKAAQNDAAAVDVPYAIYLSADGLAPEPTSAEWLAVDAAHKSIVDMTGLTTAAQLAAAAELVMDALTGITVVTNDGAANGTMTLTQAAGIFGPTTNPVLKNADGSGAGTILGVQTTSGRNTEVEVTANGANTLAIPGHLFTTGLKLRLTTTGTLPAGLATATDYYVIFVDANTIKLATNASNAAAGTAIAITDDGTGVHTTVVDTDLELELDIQASIDGINWIALEDSQGNSIAQDFTASGSYMWNVANAGFCFAKVVGVGASGQSDITIAASAKSA